MEQIRRAAGLFIFRRKPKVGNTIFRMAKRRRLSEKTAAAVMDAADLRCCMCPLQAGLSPRARNGQIHHLDEDPSNGEIDNLVYLCLEHHEDAGKVGKTSRSISPELIRRYRDRLQRRIALERAHPASDSASVYGQLLDALVVMDVGGLARSRGDEWEDACATLYKIQSYPSDIGPHSRRAILILLDSMAGEARHRMPSHVADLISSITIDLLPIRRLQERSTNFDEELLQMAAEIGASLAYDGALYVGNLELVEAGCEILWRILSFAKIHSSASLAQYVEQSFLTALDGATRSSIKFAPQLVEFTRDHGRTGSWKPLRLPDKFLVAMA